jgi:hypothetical protein|tara:strand:+ start:112 stop:312 length:201 start_codon:yes stop_codon:yes gene_type:complete
MSSRKIEMIEAEQNGIYRVKKLVNVPNGMVIDNGIIDFHERYNEDNLRTLFEECPKLRIDLEVSCQ